MALSTGLLALWELEESSGTRVNSQGSIDLDTIGGAPGSVVGKVDNAILLDGDDYVENSGAAHPFAGLDTVTIAAWVFVDLPGTGQDTVLEFRSSTTVLARLRSINITGSLEAAVRDDGGTLRTVTNGTAPIATWVHCIISYVRNDSLYFYRDNGTPTTTALIDSPYSTLTASPTVTLGATQGGGSIMAGRIDQVAVWNRTLTSDERASLYNSGNGASILAGGPTPERSYKSTGSTGGVSGFSRSWSN